MNLTVNIILNKSRTEHLMLICSFSFWGIGEPNGQIEENCITSYPTGWSAPAGAPAPEGGNQPPPNLTSNRRLQQTQAQVDEVVDIMRVNVDKVLERDQKLSELDDRADALQAGASQFETSAAKLKNKYWWKNAKMMIILGVICVIVLIIIIVYFST
uniref:Vesicle-associated membrane protein 2 n=1 Tax=Cyprinus carpio TaxID=7962 RepID=A0A8C1UMC2_CYPCA